MAFMINIDGFNLRMQALCRLGGTVVGVDACVESIAAAQLHADRSEVVKNSVTYRCITVEELASTEGAYPPSLVERAGV